MNVIDHTVAEFNAASLLRGYYAASGAGVVFYGKSINASEVHVIINCDDGFYEYTVFSKNSANRCIDSMAEDAEALGNRAFHADTETLYS